MVRGDETAYRAFHAAYFNRLSRYLFVASRGNDDAMREALQECFRRVVRHIRTFEDETVFWSWLTVVARSALTDHGRKRRRYLAFLDRFTRHSEVDAGAVDAACEGIVGAALDRALGELDAEDQALVRMKYFDQIPVRAIASRLNSTESAVESRLVRIRRKLKSGIAAALDHED